jgi:hypothetical protein
MPAAASISTASVRVLVLGLMRVRPGAPVITLLVPLPRLLRLSARTADIADVEDVAAFRDR